MDWDDDAEDTEEEDDGGLVDSDEEDWWGGVQETKKTLTREEKAAARATRAATRSAAASASAGPSTPKAIRLAPVGQRPPEAVDAHVRLFFSPVLNALVWGTSLRALARKGPMGLNVSPARGGMLWLEVGMGKTAVMIALALMPVPEAWSVEFKDHAAAAEAVAEADGDAAMAPAWDDSLLFDGDLGFAPAVLPKANVLVVVCPTLIKQWEKEVEKFAGGRLRVVIFKGFTQKRLTAVDLATKYDVVIASSDALRPPNLTAKTKTGNNFCNALRSVLWRRVVVDEAHQEPGVMETVEGFPAMAKYCVTGTPYSEKASDLAKMLGALGLPSFKHLASEPHLLGYVLDKVAVRYKKNGKLEGRQNLQLPPLTEKTLLVKWSRRDTAWYMQLEAFHSLEVERYIAEVEENKRQKALAEAQGRKHSYKAEDCRVESNKITRNHVNVLRQACAGGMRVQVPVTEDEDELALEELDEDGEYLFTSKMEALFKEVRRVTSGNNGAKVLIFSGFQGTLDYIKEKMTEEGFNFRTNENKNQSYIQKGKAQEAFQNDPPTTIFLLNAQTATVGINLTAANYIFLVEPSMNPAQERQAIGRAYSMNQTRPVTVVRMAMENSIDVRIRELHKRRAEAGELHLEAPANGVVTEENKGKGRGRGRAAKQARNQANDTMGFERSAALEDYIMLLQVDAEAIDTARQEREQEEAVRKQEEKERRRAEAELRRQEREERRRLEREQQMEEEEDEQQRRRIRQSARQRERHQQQQQQGRSTQSLPVVRIKREHDATPSS